MSYRRAAEILRRLLPVSSSQNHATIRNRTLRVGERLQAAGHCPAVTPEPGSVKTPTTPTEVTLAIDSLREGISLEDLNAQARALTDVQAGEELHEAQLALFKPLMSRTG